MPEHLLQRAQVAAAGEQVRGEAVAQRVRAHLRSEPGGRGVALHDLVEPLAGQAAAALVDEQARLPAVADQSPAPALEVGGERAGRSGADRHEPLLGALAAGAQDAGLEVDVTRLELDRLRRPQPACVHRLEQRAVAQRGRLGTTRLAQQLGDLVAAEHLGQLAALLRRAQVRGRIARQLRTAAQVAVERPQARDLPLQRRRRRRRLVLTPVGDLGREGAQLGVPDRERIVAGAPEPLAELEQVGAVGLQRVAREPALELQVGEEVEQQVLERLGARRGRRDCHGLQGFDAPRRSPARRNPRFSARGGRAGAAAR